jgi:predicted O-methyltransferase YrrM
MANYRATTQMPPLVKRAVNLAEQMEYACSCSNDAGRLLQLLTGTYTSGVIGEIATGCGVGSAWIVSSLTSSTSFFTVDDDTPRVAAARALFEPLFNVRVIQGDWRGFLQNWHFSMLYAGANSSRADYPELLFQSLREGSLIVLDGLPPQGRVSLRSRQEAGRVRDFWLSDPRLVATEIQVSPTEAVILATRVV